MVGQWHALRAHATTTIATAENKAFLNHSQSPSDASPEEGPLPGDLETAKLFGERVVAITNQFVRGRQ